MPGDAGGLVERVAADGLDAVVLTRDPLVIELTGELDVVSAPAVGEFLARISATGASEVRIEAAGLSFIDSQGLNVLMQARRRGLRFRLGAASPELLRLLELGGLAALFPRDPS